MRTTNDDLTRRDKPESSERQPAAATVPEGSGPTPGPWSATEAFEGHVFAGNRLIASAMGHKDGKEETRETNLANARLIAAAPDLLAALKTLTQDGRFSLAIGGNPRAVDALVKQVDEAINKAEGRS